MIKTAHDIIVRPVITEKSMAAMAQNKFTFEVAKGATKIDIKKAVEDILEREKSDDEDFIAALSAVILDQALIQEGVMPSDPASFAAALTKLLSE